MDKITSVIFQDQNYQDKVELELGDYELKQEGDKWFAVKKKTKYPTTYEECCFELEYIPNTDEVVGYKYNILQALQKLLVCRDAYWKIAGVEMGLEKPWEPDWRNRQQNKYVIEVYGNNVRTNSQCYSNTLLAFPTEEMRDAFYENFKELIEQCKELL